MDALPPDRPHLDFLDGLRAVAALYVLAHHCWFELFPDAMNHRPAGATAAAASVLAFGHWAVAVFIVLSGFCLTLPVAARPTRDLSGGPARFYRGRARRILPPYFAALAVSLLLIRVAIGTKNGSHWDVALPVDRRGLLGAALLVGNAIGSYRVNHAFWSVQLECQIYLLFPGLVWAARRIGMGATTVGTAVLAFAAAAGLHGRATHGLVFDGLTIQFVGLFALGMLAADLARRPPRLPAWAGAATVLASATAVAGLVWHWGLIGSVHRGHYLDAGLAGVIAPGLVLLTRAPNSWPARALSVRPLVWLGGLSYSFYLLHAPLVQVTYRYLVLPLRLPMPARLGVLIGAALAVTLAAAVPFYLAIERPFMSRRLRRTQPTARDIAAVA